MPLFVPWKLVWKNDASNNWGPVMRWRSSFFLAFVITANLPPIFAANPQAESGWDVLRTHRYLPPDFDDAVFADLWTVWPEPDRSQAEQLPADERRKKTFSYYGLMPSPGDEDFSKPALGYVDDGNHGWVMNCLACHGGKVAGKVIPGLPNSHFALQTLVEDVSLVKLKQGKKLAHLDLGATQIPLSMTNGTTNSVIFGVLLGALRKPDMSVDLTRKPPPVIHHDMDPPPFWNVKKKTSLYADGFAPKTHRPLMQFILIPRNGPEQLAQWENDFRQIQTWIESTEPPKYPWTIDEPLAQQGKAIFQEQCSRCHGSYGPRGQYEQKTIAVSEIGTDPVRWQALTPAHRRWMKSSWLSRYGEDDVEEDPVGYVAPPLDGIWASAPYFHNGSVPTLWHVLHPEERPKVWKRTEDGYDQRRVGLEVEEFHAVPNSVKAAAHRRRYFDTTLRGKSAAGHLYPNKLSEEEKSALLEYLKTL
jgi:mono/diheme cytochrome c family protein